MPEPADLIFDRDGVRAVDRAAIEEYGIPGIVLMENAARGATDVAASMLAGIDGGPHSRRVANGRGPQTRCVAFGDPVPWPRVLIVCGSGNNGGDGYAIARHLHNRGVEVVLLPIGEPREGTDAAINSEICRRMRLPNVAFEALPDQQPFHLILDAIFGTGLDRPVSSPSPDADAIRWMNGANTPVLAIDVPSGLDVNTGEPAPAHPGGVAVRATKTVTFVGMKLGFLRPAATPYIGEVEIVDIGAPIEVLRKFGQPREAIAGQPGHG